MIFELERGRKHSRVLIPRDNRCPWKFDVLKTSVMILITKDSREATISPWSLNKNTAVTRP